MELWQGIVAGIGASLAWALANVFIRRSTGSVVVAQFWGQLIGAVPLVLALRWWPPLYMPDWRWVLAGGAASGLAYFALFRAFARGPLSVLSPVVATWALISGGIGVLWLGEPLPAVRAIGAVLVVGGGAGISAVASRGNGEEERRLQPSALLWALASALGFGVMVAATRPVAEALGPVAAILAIWGAQWVVMAPAAGRIARGTTALTGPAWLNLAAWGLLEAAGFLALDLGVLVAPVTVVAPAASLSTLFTVLIAGLWLGERVGLAELACSIVVVVGVCLLGMS